MSSVWTVRSILAWMADDFGKRGLPSPRLDAELLIGHALGLGRVQVYLDLDRPLDDKELTAIRALVARRRKHEPVAYILERREFWGRPFRVTPAVLVPRPDTEILIERALAVLRGQAGTPARILDLCTGSGCIAITLAAEVPDVQADATDLSQDALEIARGNAAKLAPERVHFYAGDLWQAVPEDRTYALITANPPYIPEKDLASLAADVVDHEPRLALVGGADGLACVRRIAEGCARYLAENGTLLVEVGIGQAKTVAELFAHAGLVDIAVHRDLGNVERVVEGRRRSPVEAR